MLHPVAELELNVHGSLLTQVIGASLLHVRLVEVNLSSLHERMLLDELSTPSRIQHSLAAVSSVM